MSRYREGAFMHGRYSIGYDVNLDTGEGAIAVFDVITKQLVHISKLDPSTIDIEHEVVNEDACARLLKEAPVKLMLWLDQHGEIVPA